MNSLAVRRAIAALLKQTSALESAAAARQLEILRATRADVVKALTIADPSRFRAFHQTQLLASIDAEILRGQTRATDAVSDAVTTAYDYGQTTVDAALRAAKIHVPFGDVSPELLSAVADVVTDQTRAVWSVLGTTLKGEVRRSVLGVVDPYEAMTSLAKSITETKSFGSAEVRAEAIIRTEVNRTYSIANDERQRQSNKRLDGKLKKYWLPAGGPRTRPSHLQAGEDYGPKGNPGPIAIDQPFIVGGAALMYPLDPKGPAREVVNCRCRSVPWVADLE